MSWLILDENNLCKLEPRERLEKCEHLLRNEQDQSKRWDAVWLVGEAAREVGTGTVFEKAADLLVWVLENDNDGVVKHEVCYQIATCGMCHKIPDLLKAGLYNKSSLARHEALECLASMEAHEIKDELEKALKDPVGYVRETAVFAIKRLERMKHRKGYYFQSKIL